MTDFFTDTPMAKAIFEMVENLEDLLKEKGAEPGSSRAFIFGGCALHLHTKARGSSDLDMELEAIRSVTRDEIVMALDDVFYDDPAEGSTSLVYDLTFSPTLAPLHEDYQEDAIWLNHYEKDSPLYIYLVQKIDLAISKLGRFGDQDIEDIHTLFDHGLDIEEFRKRATEAIKYAVAPEARLTGNLNQVINLYKP
jgi:hypothetical protein